MKVMKVQIPNLIKNVAIAAPLLFAAQNSFAQTKLQNDVFEKETEPKKEITVSPKNELSPRVKIAGKAVYPALVLDLSEKQLYRYDYDTCLIDVYPVKFHEDKISKGINKINLAKHNYGKNNVAEKIYLTPVKKISGKVAKQPNQVIVGSKHSIEQDTLTFTNVILIDNNIAKDITEFMTDDQYVLIRK